MRKSESQRQQWLLLAALVGAFVLVVWLGGRTYRAADPIGADAPADQFSAQRAMTQVERIAVQPHATGSPANAQVRAYLVDTLTALGLQVEVQSQLVSYRYGRYPNEARFAQVHNVLARLPGRRADGPQLVLMSHYDSRESTPGAGDAASGVATLLETARAMSSAEQPLNDVLFVITDGEEIGLMGAQAFFRHRPAAKRPGLVLNFDARGSRGPVFMFETSAAAGALVEAMQQVVEHPVANSLSLAAYKQLPNDTDLSIALEAGLPGMNFAFIDGFFDYHEATDTPQRLSLNTLQHLGNYALPLATHFANADTLPPPTGTERSFYLLPGLGLIGYPLWIDMLAGVALGLLLIIAIRRLKAEANLRGSELMRGFCLAVLLLALPAISLTALQLGWFSGDGMRSTLAQLARPHWLWWSFALLQLALGLWLLAAARLGKGSILIIGFALLVSAVQLFSGELWWTLSFASGGVLLLAAVALYKPLPGPALMAGAALLWLVLLPAMAWWMPAGLFLLVVPMLLPAAWWIVAGRDVSASIALGLISALAALPSALLLIPFSHTLFGMLSVLSAAAPLALLSWVLITALPVLLTRDLRRPAAALTLGSLGCLAFAAWQPPFNAEYPAPASVFTVQTDDELFRVSDDAVLGDWQRGALGEPTQSIDSGVYAPGRGQTVTRGPALQLNPVPGVELTVRELTSEGPDRRLRLHLKVPPEARQVQLYLPSRLPLLAWQVDGEALSPPAALRGPWRVLRGYALPEGGVNIDLALASDGDLNDLSAQQLVVSAWRPQPGGDYSLPARPDDLMRHPYSFADGLLTVQRFSLQPEPEQTISQDSFESARKTPQTDPASDPKNADGTSE